MKLLKAYFQLETELLAKEQILKKNTQAKLLEEVMLVEYIIQTKHELVGGKTDIQNTLPKY